MLATGPFNELGYGYEFDEEAKSGGYTIDFEALAAQLSAIDAAARRNGGSIRR